MKNNNEFQKGESVIVKYGEYEGHTGCIFKISPFFRSLNDGVHKIPKEMWGELLDKYNKKYGNMYSVFLDLPIENESEIITHIEIEDAFIEKYDGEIEKTYCAARDENQSQLRNRLINYMSKKKVSLHKIVDDIGSDFTRLSSFKNDKSGLNRYGRPVRYLYPKEYYILKKYLEEKEC